ncbi:hypothetical protein FUMI01_01630 [Flavobacterium sp. UMI-01]|nr:hypothetical protein FUMI01_01630 [Flavobacterium sp. UMI-01]
MTVLVGISYFYPTKQKTIEIVILVVLVFFSGFRKRIGTDYDSYVAWYLKGTRDSDFECGFLFIMKVFRYFNLNPAFLFFFFSFLTCCLVYLGIKNYTSNSNIALLFFVMIPSLYLTSFTLVRQSFSMAIAFYAFYYLINKKYLIYLGLMLIGISFHKSLIVPFILFIVVFQYVNRINEYFICVMLVLSYLLSKFGFVYVFDILFKNSRYSYYFSAQNIEMNPLKLILLNLECILILYYFKRLKKNYSYHHYLIILYSLSIIFVNLLSEMYEMSRIANYFRIFGIIVIADLILLEVNRKRLVLFSFFYILYFGAFINGLLTDIKINNNKAPTFIPYKSLIISIRSNP